MLKDWVRSWRHSFFPVDFDILHEQFCTKGEQSGNAAAPGGAVFQLCSVLASLLRVFTQCSGEFYAQRKEADWMTRSSKGMSTF